MVDRRYHLTLATTENGTVMNGWWSSRVTAERKFRSWIGSYSVMPGARITLTERLDNETEQVLQSWPD
ncbi:hypothetical protein ACFV90_36605 [Streptomyces sp. NPDC059904]|uniref:hypothetical protein n=1 Tax=Streptomyces sp. NPDC059904 TaxID=3346996 RepID=UPI00365394A3